MQFFRCSILLSVLIIAGEKTLSAQTVTGPEPKSEPGAEKRDEVVAPTFHRPNHECRELPMEGQQLIRSIILILLPQRFEDDDGWGEEKRIQSGLNLDIEDGRIRTSRRWKNVNHGTWLQGSGELVDPAQTFELKVTQLPDPDEVTQKYDISMSARMQVRGRQQQWSYGVMLWSVSADATVDVRLEASLNVRSEVVSTEKGTRLRFLPEVTAASARLDHFRLHRISHAKGDAVKGIGELIEELIRLRLRKENKDLAGRINKVLRKKPESLEIPFDIGGWFGITPLRKDPASETTVIP